ncbi:hypothetical protein [Mesorhizobium sp. NBSH29]|nr:hypothetical protein [Mesorhizobium sp. NBSH29]
MHIVLTFLLLLTACATPPAVVPPTPPAALESIPDPAIKSLVQEQEEAAE